MNLVAAVDAARRGPRWFADSADAPRSRRASDLIELVSGSLLLALLAAIESPQPAFTRALADLLRSLPSMVDAVWQVIADLGVVLAIVLVVVAAARRRWRIARDLVLAAVVALVVAMVAARFVDGAWPELTVGLRRSAPPEGYAPARLAIAAAVVVTAAPHLALPIRRTGRWVLGAAAAAMVALGAASVFGVVAALLVAVIASSLVHLALGSSAGRPGLAVGSALAELGVTVTALQVADRQQAGVFVVDALPGTATTGDGTSGGSIRHHANGPVGTHAERLVVKVYGRDAHGSAVLSALWRTVWYREPVSAVGLGRRQQVQHEAFLTLLARQSGIPTDTVVTAGTTADDDALLVLRRSARPIDTDQDTDLIGGLWDLVAALSAAGIAHGQIDPDHLVVVDPGGRGGSGRGGSGSSSGSGGGGGRGDGGDGATAGDDLGLIDFRAARTAPTALHRRTDLVQTLVTLVMLLGEERGLESAARRLGPDGIAEVLPLLQVSALTPAQRDWVRTSGLDLDELRAVAAASVGIELPEQLELRRFTLGSIVKIVLPGVALFALAGALSGFDLRAVADQFADAVWWFVLLGFLIGQLPRISQAVSTLGASPVPLPLGPVYALQLAVSYVNLAIPSSAARMAINIRFFQRHGVPPGGALAAGALDGFSGFVMQMFLLAGFLLLTPLSLDLDLDLGAGAGSSARLLLIVVAVGAVALSAVFAIRGLRELVVDWARRLRNEAVVVLRGLRSPRRLALLLGGNVTTEVLFALSLVVFLRAFGVSIGIGEVLFVVIAVSLLAGILPVPGGIGVSEGGLIYGLIVAGVPDEIAFAAVIGYRLATFYLPPIWGFVALRWLERNQHL